MWDKKTDTSSIFITYKSAVYSDSPACNLIKLSTMPEPDRDNIHMGPTFLIKYSLADNTLLIPETTINPVGLSI